MKESDRIARNTERLAECYPTFRVRAEKVILAMEAAGFRPRIQDAWRSPADQLAAFSSGHSTVKWGMHSATGAKGEKDALAVDMIDDDYPLNSRKTYCLHLAACARSCGLQTGVLWGLTPTLRKGVEEALAAHNWSAPVKIGFDPTHVEATGLTYAEAKAGKRPK